MRIVRGMIDFATLIARWPKPSIRNFADDIGVAYVTAQMMKHRNSIRPEYWADVVRAAQERQIEGVTLESLQQLAERRRRKCVGNESCAAA